MELNRRDFHKLTAAALGGAVAGTMMGCGGEPAAPQTAAPTGDTKPAGDAAAGTEVAAVTGEPHACRGLNACKGQGADGKNTCAGTGTCATKSWHHDCGGQNACKGQGGCGEDPGLNKCKGEGGCHIPLMDEAWTKVRARFEQDMKKAGKEVGKAPPAKDA